MPQYPRFIYEARKAYIMELVLSTNVKVSSETYGEEFEALYAKYESEGKHVNRFLLVIYLIRLSFLKLKLVFHISYIQMLQILNQIRKSGMIKSINLCSEILEYSDTKEYACCILASICLPQCVTEKDFSNV